MDSDLPIKSVDPAQSNEIAKAGTPKNDLAKEVDRKFREDLKEVVNRTNGFESFWYKLAGCMSKLTKKLLG